MKRALVVWWLIAACGPREDWPDPPANSENGVCPLPLYLGDINLSGNAGLASQFENPEKQVIFTQAELNGEDGPALLTLSLWEGAGAFSGGFQTGSYVLSGKEAELKSCGICLSIATVDQDFFAFFGVVTIDALSAETGGVLSANVSELQLREVRYDQHGTQSDAGTPCNIGIENIDIEMSVQGI